MMSTLQLLSRTLKHQQTLLLLAELTSAYLATSAFAAAKAMHAAAAALYSSGRYKK